MKTKLFPWLLSLIIVTASFHVSSQNTELDQRNFQRVLEASHSNYYDVLNQGNQFFELYPDLMNEEDGIYQDFVRWKLFWGKRISNISPDAGSIDKLNLAYFNYLSKSSSAANTTASYSLQPICPTPGSYSANWSPVGPMNSSNMKLGKVQSILVDETDPTFNTVYLGAPNGGVFKCTNFNDATPNWICMTENTGIPGLWVNTMVMDPISKDLYLGTGNYRDGYCIGVIGLHQNGQYFLTSLTLGPGNAIPPVKEIIKQSSNPNIMFALTDNVIYRTTDAWANVANLTQSPAPGVNLRNEFYDMAFDPTPVGASLGRLLYAGKLYNNTGTYLGGQIWSYSSGVWTDLSSNLPVPVTFSSVINIESSGGALYILFASTSGEVIYKTLDGGASWIFVRNITPTYINYGSEVRLVMNPNDPDNIFVERPWPYSQYRCVFETKNGGVTWIQRTAYGGFYNGCYNHGDIRYITLIPFPGNPNHDLLYFGTDGGILYSNDQSTAATYLQDKNGLGLNISQFYALSCAENKPNYFVVGAQDNGTFEYDHGTWYDIFGGDGFGNAVENNSTYIYSENSGGTYAPDLFYRTDNTQLFHPTNSGLNYLSEFLDRNDNDKLYRFEKDVKFSTNHGLIWTTISQFGSNLSDINHCGTITSVAVDPQNNQHLIAIYGGPTWNKDLSQCTNICTPQQACVDCTPGGTNCPLSHKYYVTHDGGANWTDETFRFDKHNPLFDPLRTDVFRWSEVSKVVFNPDNSQEIWICFGNFWETNGVGVNRVNRSLNGGITWTDYSENLAPFAVNCMIAQPNSNGGVYIGTDVGVFYRDNSMSQWECFNDGLPIPLVTDLEIDYCRNKLLASTYGRGIWEGNLVPSSVTLPLTVVNWSAPRKVTTDIIVPSGCTLNITADINIARGRKITVKQNGILNILTGSHLYNGCGEMWDGVYCESGSTIKVNNSTIEDAYQAFNLRDGVSYSFTENHFEKNYIGIKMGDNSIRHSMIGDIFGNEFKCSGTLPPYFGVTIPGLTPNTKSLCGVYLQNVDFLNLGKAGQNINYFKNMENGVLSFSSNMTVTNSRFMDIKNNQHYSALYMGSGIYSKSYGNYLMKMVGGQVNGPEFLRCDFGINIENQKFVIQVIYMDDVETGIQISNCREITGFISQNHLVCNQKGIALFQNDAAKFILASYNNIEIAGNVTETVGGSYGIGVFEQNHGIVPHINILSNQVLIHYGFEGITATSCDNLIVTNNAVTLTKDNNSATEPNSNVLGIAVNGCNRTSIWLNTVTGNNIDVSSTQIGIETNINAGSPNYFTCNTSRNTWRNFDFGGGGMTSVLSGNIIGDGYEGLHITSNCFIGEQRHGGNCFDGVYGNPDGAAINLNTNPLYLHWSAFYVNELINSCYLPTNNHPPGDWFISETQDEFRCDNVGCNPCDEDQLKQIDLLIAQDHFGATNYNDQVKWDGRKYLMEKLNKYPDLLISNPLLQTFYTLYENTSMDGIIHIGFGMLNADQMTMIQALQFEHNDSLITDYVDSLENLNINLSNSTDPTEQQNFKNQIVSLNPIIQNLQQSNIYILETFKTQREQGADNIKIENSAINAGLLIEENIKLVNDIYLRTFAKGIYTLSEADQSTLYSIASQCPYEGGLGVYRARSMYSQLHPRVMYADKYNCAQLGYLRTRPGKSTFVASTSIVPNPVSNKANLLYSLQENSEGLCRIYNSLGENVISFSVKSDTNSKEFDTEPFNNGIYYYVVTINGESISSGQFTVAK